MIRGSWHIGAVAVLLIICCGAQNKRFPEFRVVPLTLPGAWEQAPVVVVGDLKDVAAFGVQEVNHLPWPISPSVRRLYWCEATLHIVSTVKGRAPSAEKKFVWGSVQPGCRTSYAEQWKKEDGPLTEVWFLREDADYIRPVIDGGGEFNISFRSIWEAHPNVSPGIEFGQLLLSPMANANNLSDYAHGSLELMSLACVVLGDRECVERIKALARMEEPDLRRAACDFLSTQFQEKCPIAR